jgi:multidrug resistance efflux pump
MRRHPMPALLISSSHYLMPHCRFFTRRLEGRLLLACLWPLLFIDCTTASPPPTLPPTSPPPAALASPPDPSPAVLPSPTGVVRSASPETAQVTLSPTAGVDVRTMAVRRGTMAETITLDGWVADREKMAIAPTRTVQVQRVLVAPGDTVREGQPLIALVRPEQRITDARSRVEAAEARAAQGRTAAEALLRQATADIGRLDSQSLSAELLVAQGAASQARAGVQRAGADLARLTAPPDPEDVEAADQEVRAAQLALRKAEADRERLAKGASDSDIRKAENEVAAAENGLTRAKEALRKLMSGPDPFEVRAAERALAESQSSLTAARRRPPEVIAAQETIEHPPGQSSRERETARSAARRQVETVLADQRNNVERAEHAVAAAEDNLKKALRGPAPGEVEVASREVETAQRILNDATDQLNTVRTGPSEFDLNVADSSVSAARVTLARASSRRAALDAGQPDDQIAAARAAIDSARSALGAADLKVTDLTNQLRRQTQELGDAQARAELIRALLDGRVNPVDVAARPDTDSEVRGLAEALVALDAERASLAELVDDSVPTTLAAPADGMITAVSTDSGELLEPSSPAVTMVRTGDLGVKARVPDDDGSRVVQGLSAQVRVDSAPATDLAAEVSRIDESDGIRTASLSVVWSTPLPTVGSGAKIVITVQRREAVLLVPSSAIRVIDDRRFVDVVDGPAPRQVEVSTGLSNGAEVEITNGLQEGVPVVVNP